MQEENESSSNAQQDDAGATRSDEVIGPVEAAKRVALAGLGAVAVATEATDEVFRNLVKKGEAAREDAVREVNEARLRGADRLAESETFIRSRVDAVFSRANLATRDEIDALNAKLDTIAQKLDALHAPGAGTSVGGASYSERPTEPPATPESPSDQRPL